jgi:hypothetical protein
VDHWRHERGRGAAHGARVLNARLERELLRADVRLRDVRGVARAGGQHGTVGLGFRV